MGKIERLVKSKLFIFICTAYYFLVWVTGQEAIGLSLALLAAAFLLVFFRDMTGVATVLSLFITGISLKQLPFEIIKMAVLFTPDAVPAFVIPVIAVALTVFVAAIIVHFVRFRPSREIWHDPMTYCFFAVFAAILLGGIFSQTFSFFVSVLIMLLYFLLFLAYRLYRSCGKDFDFREYAALIVVMIGLSASIETFIYFIGQDDFFNTLVAKNLQIGWGITNSIAPYLVLGIPMAAYLYIKNKNFVYLFISFLQLAGLFLTMSRGEIAAFLLVSPALVFFLRRYAKANWGELYKQKRFEFAGLIALSVIIVTIIGIANFDYLADFVKRIANPSENGRSPLRLLAAVAFAKSPFFGGGFSQTGSGFGLPFVDGNINLMLPHSLLFDLFATMGVVGAGVFAVYYYFKYRQLLTAKSMFGVFALLSIFPYALYSFADLTFYFVQIQFLSLLILEALRREAANGECTEYKTSALYRKALFKNKPSTFITLAVGAVLAALLIALFFMFGNEIYIFNIRASYIIMGGIACLVEITLLPSVCRVIKDNVQKRRARKTESHLKDISTDSIE